METADDEDWTDVDYLTCLWGGVRAKKQRIRRNMLSDMTSEPSVLHTLQGAVLHTVPDVALHVDFLCVDYLKRRLFVMSTI